MDEKSKPTIFGENSVFIDDSVTFGRNVVIHPNNIIKGKTTIGDNVTLLPNNFIKDCTISANCTIDYSYLEESVVQESTRIGPFSRIRPKSKIGKGCKIGNFVEIKNSNIGDGSKACHLAYVGDAEIGKDCNIGCGAIFVNYNGKNKFRTKVGNNCFIGSNVNVVAPVNIADNSYICAGTTITKNTNPYDFVIGRTKETIKSDYAKKYIKETK